MSRKLKKSMTMIGALLCVAVMLWCGSNVEVRAADRSFDLKYRPYEEADYELTYVYGKEGIIITGIAEIRDEQGELIKATGKLVIPSEIDGEPVVTIGANAFSNRKGSFSGDLEIPEGVKRIESSAFSSCGMKGKLVLPSTLEYIGTEAFMFSGGLTGDLVIPKGVKRIESEAFYECKGFDGKLILSEGLEYIGSQAFYKCEGFTGDLIIPDSVTEVEVYAFYGCRGFDGKLSLSEKMTNINEHTFYDCVHLTGDLIIPEGVSEIGRYAFYNCYGLDGELSLPQSLKKIGASTFYGCFSLKGNLIIPDSVQEIGAGAFYGCEAMSGDLKLPKNLTYIGNNTFNGCKGLTGELTIPDTVVWIGRYAFSECSGLSGTVVIPENVTGVKSGAFLGCTGMSKHVYVTEKLEKIDEGAFFMTINDIDEVDSNARKQVTIHAPKGSYGEIYAKKYGYTYAEWKEGELPIVETCYREQQEEINSLETCDVSSKDTRRYGCFDINIFRMLYQAELVKYSGERN